MYNNYLLKTIAGHREKHVRKSHFERNNYTMSFRLIFFPGIVIFNGKRY